MKIALIFEDLDVAGLTIRRLIIDGEMDEDSPSWQVAQAVMDKLYETADGQDGIIALPIVKGNNANSNLS